MFFVLFYNSNLRQTLIVPDYEPQIHNAEDILFNNIKVIYTDTPNESLEQKFIHEKQEYPDIYNMVGGIIRIIIFFFELFHFYYACFSSVMANQMQISFFLNLFLSRTLPGKKEISFQIRCIYV